MATKTRLYKIEWTGCNNSYVAQWKTNVKLYAHLRSKKAIPIDRYYGIILTNNIIFNYKTKRENCQPLKCRCKKVCRDQLNENNEKPGGASKNMLAERREELCSLLEEREEKKLDSSFDEKRRYTVKRWLMEKVTKDTDDTTC